MNENLFSFKAIPEKNIWQGGGGGGGVKLRVQHVKCILSFREDETKAKIQLIALFRRFHRKPDINIRQLQVRMRISAINSPTPQWLVCGASSGLRGCRRQRSSKIGGRIQTLNTTFLLTSMQVFGTTFAAKLNVTARHWILLRKENRGGGGGGGGGVMRD